MAERVFTGAEWCARLAGGAAGRPAHDPDQVLRVFVSGDRSQVGKSSVCLGLVASLVERLGFAPSEVAYIKPATQCEQRQLVTRYCEARGVECVPIGPVVYVSGFTREFLAGNTLSSDEMRGQVADAVQRLCDVPGRRVVVVDGVGYPSVGSIVGLSNAVLAQASRAPVLLVCPNGVGNAVDSFNMLQTFFAHHGVPVLGGIFNRFATEGFYSLDKARESIKRYFEQMDPDHMPYGFLPELPALVKASPAPRAAATVEAESKDAAEWSEEDEARLGQVLDAFAQYVDVHRILADARAAGGRHWGAGGKRPLQAAQGGGAPAPAAKRSRPLSTAEIRARAVAQGGRAGG